MNSDNVSIYSHPKEVGLIIGCIDKEKREKSKLYIFNWYECIDSANVSIYLLPKAIGLIISYQHSMIIIEKERKPKNKLCHID